MFLLHGDIHWGLGLALAVANVIGAQIGARIVLAKGAGMLRILILVLVVVMSVKLGYDQFTA